MKKFMLILAAALLAWGAAAQPGGGPGGNAGRPQGGRPGGMPQGQGMIRQMTPPTGDNFEMKEIHVQSAGNDIYGEAYIPKAPGKHPAVILSHGFGSTLTGFYSLIPALVAEGYVCYCYDFSGGGRGSRSTGKTTDMSIFTERQNLIDVLNAVRGWDSVDPSRVFLLDVSQGGCVSAITAPKVQDKIRAILLIYPALCIPDDARALYKTVADIPETVNFMGMEVGKAYYEGTVDPSYDIYADILPYDKDVLIVHGTNDSLVKPEYSAKASNVYKNCELHLIFGAGHGFNTPEQQALYHQYVLDFLKKEM